MAGGFDIAGAREAGYSDEEIAGHLAMKSGFDLTGARQAGYSFTDIVDHLSPTPAPKPEPASTAESRGTWGGDIKTGFVGTSQSMANTVAVRAAQEIASLKKQIETFKQGEPDLPPQMRHLAPQRQRQVPLLEKRLAEAEKRYDDALKESAQDAGTLKTLPVNEPLQRFTGGEVGEILKNPGAVARGLIGQSLTPMLPVVAGVAVGGPAGGAIAGGMLGAATGGGSEVQRILAQRGINVSDPEAVRKALETPDIRAEVDRAFGRGQAIEGATQAAAGALGGVSLSGQTAIGTAAKNVAIQAAGQGSISGAGEAAKQAAIEGELNLGKIAASAIGEALFAPVEAAAGAFHARARPEAAGAAVMQADSVDQAISVARSVVDAPSEAAALAEYGNRDEQQQAKLLRLFGGLNDGVIERAGDGSYFYRLEGAAEPLRVWDERVPREEGAAPTISPTMAAAQRDHYRRLGVDVVYFDDIKRVPFDGAVDPQAPNTIFLSNNPQRNAAQVGAHEFTHLLEDTTLPDGTNLGDLLHRQISEGITESGWEHARARFGETAPARSQFEEGPEGDAAHANAVASHLIRELGSDIGGEAPKFQTFLPRVVSEVEARYGAQVAKDILRKLIDGIQQAMRTMREFFSRPEEMAEYGQPETVSQNWVTNLDEIHATLARAYAERYGTQAEKENARLADMRRQAERDRGERPQLRLPAPALVTPPPPRPRPAITPENVFRPETYGLPGSTPRPVVPERTAPVDRLPETPPPAAEPVRPAPVAETPRPAERPENADERTINGIMQLGNLDRGLAERAFAKLREDGVEGRSITKEAIRRAVEETAPKPVVKTPADLAMERIAQLDEAERASRPPTEQAAATVAPADARPVEPVAPPVQPAPRAGGWEEIGKNHIGQTLYEDGRGVRFYVENGVQLKDYPIGTFGNFRFTTLAELEPVRLGRPETGNISVDRAHRPEYQLAEPHPTRPDLKPEYRAPEPEPAPTPAAPPDRFANNKLFTTDKVEAARARLREKLGGNRLTSGFDPEIMLDGMTIAGAHIEAGVRDFASFAKAMIEDIGHGVRPYLLSFYEGVRNYPGLDTKGMTPQGEAARLHAEHLKALEKPEGHATIESEAQNGDRRGVVQQPGEGLGAGTPRVPDETQSSPVQEPKPIRKPRRASAFGGRGGGRPTEPRPWDRSQGDERPAVPGEGDGVTKPPAVDSGDNQARPDTPASAGISDARKNIEERSRSNYRITPEDRIGEGTPRDKVRANIEAIRILKLLEDEARDATPDEKAKLVKYTGWGAFAQDMFLDRSAAFRDEREAFRALVTDAEYEAARTSTLNAHYTSSDVISGMWDAIQRFGYEGGMALEPSAGIGHFIGLIPDAVAPRTAWTAVELDPLTARIAKSLYGGAEVNNQGFETLKRPANYYDLVISNVPFGDYKISEKPYGSHSIHDFFFVKSLDKVRPGGVVAFVTSRYTMDRQDSSVRLLMAKNADLVGAIRLPGGREGAFAGNAGTQVTTDILFLRKRVPGEALFGDAKWLVTREIQTPEGPARINEYFADRPDMMLGEMRLKGTMYRPDEPVLIGDSTGLREKIAEAADRMPPGAFTAHEPRPPSVTVGVGGKDGGFVEKDGAIYRNVGGEGVPYKLGPEATARFKRLIGLRDTVNDLLGSQIASDTAKADSLRRDLRKAYDAFVRRHGPINKEVTTVTKRLNREGQPVSITRRPNIDDFLSDPDAQKVAALEHYDPETGKATRAAIQDRPVISPPVERQINGPGDALAAALDTKGRVDIHEIGRLMGARTEDEVIGRLGDLIYQNPDGREWQSADQYLSGDVVRKLEEARSIAASDPSFRRNVEALEKVQPPPLTGADIDVQFGASWVPTDVYQAFLRELGAYQPKVTRLPVSGTFRVESRGFSNEAQVKYGTERVDVGDVVDAALNNRKITVKDRVGPDEYVVNHEETQEAQIKVDALKEAFSGDRETGIEGWAFQDPQRAEQLEAIYNRTFNTLAPRKFDGAHQTFPGMSADLSLRPHQKDAVWRTVQNGNTLLAHVVGAGKTYTMIASGMEQKRLGLITKPAFVVPNHMLEQFSREFIQAYPNARLLVASKDEMSRESRQAFIAKAAANDWDGIVITHDAFGRIGVSQEVRAKFLREQAAELERAIEAETAETGKKSPTVKEMVKALAKLEERLKILLNAERKDAGTTFEETGIDHIFLDEAHLFKNLAFATRLQRIKGLAQGNSQRAEDLFMKIRFLEEKRPGRSAVFATGTPVSNTMAELWTMMRYLAFDKLKERGLENFDSWANTFGKIRTTMELGADARSLQEVSSFSKFVNVPELISLYSEIADTKTADMLNLPRPEVRNARGERGIEIVQAEPSPAEEAYIQQLVELAESLKGQRPEKGKPNMLSVVTAGRKVATDGRLVDPGSFSFNPNGKIALAADRIYDIYAKGKDPALAQMVFLDLGVPGDARAKPKSRPENEAESITGEDVDPTGQDTSSRFNLYGDLKQRLVDKGIPADEIAFIHDANTDEKKAKLFKRVRSGDVRVLVGSSSKMGVGTNVQDRLIAMHHLDAPWKPAEVEQRDGRIVRQGNLNPEVQIYRYITKRSFDAFMWQKLDTKSQFIAQVLSGAKGARHAEDIDSPLPEAAEMKAAASGDPRIMEHADLTRQVRQLQAQKRSFETTAARAKVELDAERSLINLYESELPAVRADAGKARDLSGDKFSVELGGQTFTERKAAGEKILQALLGQRDVWRPVQVELGRLSGFDMSATLQQKYDGGIVYLDGLLQLKGEKTYTSTSSFVINSKTDPGGLVRRFENVLNAIREQPRRYEEYLADGRAAVQRREATSGAAWPRAAELAERSARLAALTKDMAKKEGGTAQEIKAEPTGEIDQGKPLFSPRITGHNPERTYTPEQQQADRDGPKFSPRQVDTPEFKRWTFGDNPNREYTAEQQQAKANVRGSERLSLQERIAEFRQDLGKKVVREMLDPYVGLRDRDPAGYMAARLANSAIGAVDMFNVWGTLKFNGPAYATDKQTGGPVGLIRRLGPEAHDFMDWVAANRAERLKAEDRENLFTTADIAALKSLNRGQLDFDYDLGNGKTTRSREKAYLDALRRLDDANQNAVSLAVDSGLLKRGVADALWSNPFYVPFYRQAEESNTRAFVGAGGFTGQTAGKRLTGGTEKLNTDLWGNAFGNWAHMIDASIRNKAANQILEQAEKDGIVTRLTLKEFNHEIGRAEKAESVWTMVDGEKVHWRVEDPFTLKAITALDYVQSSLPGMGIGRAAKKLLQVGVAASPIFQIRSLIRDTSNAIAVSPISKNIFRNLYDGARQQDIGNGLQNVARAVAGHELEMADISRETADAIAGGATVRYAAGADQSFRKADTYLDSDAKLAKFWQYFRRVGHASTEAMAFGENVNRLALYQQLGDQPHALRAYEGRDLSDFSLVGASPLIRHLVELVPYMNPWMQGLYKVGRVAAGSDKSVTLAVGGKVAAQLTTRLAFVIAGMTAINLALDALYSDDPDYRARNEYDRNSNFWFKVGGTEFRIPMGFEVAALSRMAAVWIESLYDTDMSAARAWKNTLSILGTQMAFNPIPQVVKPLYDLDRNETRMGTPIETQGMERLRPEFRSGPETTLVSKGVSGAANKVVRGAFGQNARAFSPVQLDYLVQAYSGWLGTSALQIADTVVRGLSNEPEKPAKGWLDKLSGGIASNDPTSERTGGLYVNMLYQQGDAIKEAYATYRDLLKRQRIAEAREYLEENRDLIVKYPLFEGAIRTEGAINQRVQAVSDDPRMTGEQKKIELMRLNALRNKAAERVFAPAR